MQKFLQHPADGKIRQRGNGTDNHRKIRKNKVNPKDSTQFIFCFYSGEVLLSSARFIKHRVKASDFSGLLRKM